MGIGRSYNLRVDLEDWSNERVHAEYSTFRVSDASSDHLMNFTAFLGGDAGIISFLNNFTSPDGLIFTARQYASVVCAVIVSSVETTILEHMAPYRPKHASDNTLRSLCVALLRGTCRYAPLTLTCTDTYRATAQRKRPQRRSISFIVDGGDTPGDDEYRNH